LRLGEENLFIHTFKLDYTANPIRGGARAKPQGFRTTTACRSRLSEWSFYMQARNLKSFVASIEATGYLEAKQMSEANAALRLLKIYRTKICGY